MADGEVQKFTATLSTGAQEFDSYEAAMAAITADAKAQAEATLAEERTKFESASETRAREAAEAALAKHRDAIEFDTLMQNDPRALAAVNKALDDLRNPPAAGPNPLDAVLADADIPEHMRGAFKYLLDRDAAGQQKIEETQRALAHERTSRAQEREADRIWSVFNGQMSAAAARDKLPSGVTEYVRERLIERRIDVAEFDAEYDKEMKALKAVAGALTPPPPPAEVPSPAAVAGRLPDAPGLPTGGGPAMGAPAKPVSGTVTSFEERKAAYAKELDERFNGRAAQA